VVNANSSVPARYLGRDLFGTWQYANTRLLVLSPLTWARGAKILVPRIAHPQKNYKGFPIEHKRNRSSMSIHAAMPFRRV